MTPLVTLTPALIASVTGGRYVGPEEKKETPVTGFVTDNREVSPGSVFVCIVGERTDGHTYAPAAIEAGAAMVLAEKDVPAEPYVLVPSAIEAMQTLASWYRSQLNIPIVGIVGSVGKTTAKELVADVLSARHSVYRTPKNQNSQIGVPITVLSIRERHTAAVIEMGISEFGQMDKLGAIVRPDMVVFTAVAACHLEFLGDLDGVYREKSQVFKYLPENGLAVVCGDDPRLAECDPGVKKRTFGFGENCDYRAVNIVSHGFEGTAFDISADGTLLSAFVPSYGEHLPSTAAAAAAIGRELGLTDVEIAEGLRHYAPVGGRANVRGTPYLTVVDDCYNANPASMASSMRSLCGLTGSRCVILGDMKELGTESEKLHFDTGVLAASLPLDRILCCGADAKAIYEGACSAGASERCFWYPDRDQLIAALPDRIRKGDTVLVKASRSMRFEVIVAELMGMR